MRRHGMMSTPAADVSSAARANVKVRGARAMSALTGAMMLAGRAEGRGGEGQVGRRLSSAKPGVGSARRAEACETHLQGWWSAWRASGRRAPPRCPTRPRPWPAAQSGRRWSAQTAPPWLRGSRRVGGSWVAGWQGQAVQGQQQQLHCLTHVSPLVTARPAKQKSAMKTGRPTAWPTTCARWLRAYLLKSGMLIASVAQYLFLRRESVNE